MEINALLKEADKTFQPTWANEVQKESYRNFLQGRAGIECKKIFYWEDGKELVEKDPNREQEFRSDYPKTWPAPCCVCHGTFKSIPLFWIVRWNYEKGGPVIRKLEVMCGKRCYTEMILRSSDLNKGQHFEYLGKFCKKYLQFEVKEITFVPLSLRKDLNPIGGIYEKDSKEWHDACNKAYVFIAPPVFMAVDTFACSVDKSKMIAENLDYKVNTEVSDERQKEYEQNMAKYIPPPKDKKTTTKPVKSGNVLFSPKDKAKIKSFI